MNDQLNGIGDFPIYVKNKFYPPVATRLLPDLTMQVTQQVSYYIQELLTICEHLVHPQFFGEVLAAHVFSFPCWVIFLCLTDYLFFISPLVFFKVYLKYKLQCISHTHIYIFKYKCKIEIDVQNDICENEFSHVHLFFN